MTSFIRVLALTFLALLVACNGGRLDGTDSPYRADDMPTLGETSPLARAILGTTAGTSWTRSVSEIALQFDAHHPQGMIKRGDYFYITSVESEPNQGHLYKVDLQGNLVADIVLVDGERYHPGGLDADDAYLYTGLAEYRRDSTAQVVRIAFDTLEPEFLFEVDDHVGAAVYRPLQDEYYGVSWGSRRRMHWSAQGEVMHLDDNPSHWVDYQDCQSVDHRYFLCSGLASTPGPFVDIQTGGIALIAFDSLRIVHEVPTWLWNDNYTIANRNPVFFERDGDILRFWSLPDDGAGTIVAWESPVQEDRFEYFGEPVTAKLPPLPPIAQALTQVNHKSDWRELRRTRLKFNAHHGQGLVKVGDDFVLSAVDRVTQGGYLIKFDAAGNLIQEIQQTQGAAYHPGGIDYDGESIWVPIAEYVRDSTAVVYKLDPQTMQIEKAFDVPDDHVGGIVRDGDSLFGVSWGSRRIMQWTLDGELVSVQANPTHWTDYQDCQSLGSGYAACFGVITADTVVGIPQKIGGVYLVHLPSNTLVHGFGWPGVNEHMDPNTNNTGFLELDGNTLRAYFASDDYLGNLFVFEVAIDDARTISTSAWPLSGINPDAFKLNAKGTSPLWPAEVPAS